MLLKNFKPQLHGANLAEIAKANNCKKSEILDFSSNLNPMGPSKNAELAIIENIGNISNYPQDTNRLKTALSNYLAVDKNNLFIDNGSAAVIFKIFNSLKFKKVDILKPTFSEYEHAALSLNCNVNNLSVSDLDKADFNSEALFICNPNNPTTLLLDKQFIERIARTAEEKGSFIIIDEAFMDFVAGRENYSVIDLVEKIPNLIVIGSLTKFFALAGLRVGYLCANKNIVEKMERISPPWLINTLTAEATCASLIDTSYIQITRSQIPKLRQSLLNELKNVEAIKTYDSEINFILTEVKKPLSSTFIYEELAKRKILIRDCLSFNMGSRFIRLSVKLTEQNKKLVNALNEVLNEIS